MDVFGLMASYDYGEVHMARDAAKSRARVLEIYETIVEIAERSRKTLTPTYRVADLMVEERLTRAPLAVRHA